VTPVQLKQTNILFNQLEYLEKQDSLNNQLITYYVDWTNKLEEKDSLRQSSVEELNKQISSMDNVITTLKDNNIKLSKQKKIATNFAIGGGITSVCLILLLILL
jgi:molecular chaperone DnaK (HSP70)